MSDFEEINRHLTLINEGKRAEIAHEVLHSVVKNRKDIAISALLALFRSGKTELGLYLIEIAKLHALSDIESMLKRSATRGHKSQEAIHGTSNPTPKP